MKGGLNAPPFLCLFEFSACDVMAYACASLKSIAQQCLYWLNRHLVDERMSARMAARRCAWTGLQ